jgi:hypothetical protein
MESKSITVPNAAVQVFAPTRNGRSFARSVNQQLFLRVLHLMNPLLCSILLQLTQMSVSLLFLPRDHQSQPSLVPPPFSAPQVCMRKLPILFMVKFASEPAFAPLRNNTHHFTCCRHVHKK